MWREEENTFLLVSNYSPLKWILDLTLTLPSPEKEEHWIMRQENRVSHLAHHFPAT